MTLSIHRGDTFLFYFPGSPSEHLNIVITEVEKSTGNFVYVGIESFENPRAERTVALYPGEHEFITKKSCPVYRLADTMSVSDLEYKIAKGSAIPREPMSEEIIQRITTGLLSSDKTRRDVAEFYRSMTWLL